jgi:hypothetical protein
LIKEFARNSKTTAGFCRQFPLQESRRFVSLSDVRWLSPALLVVLLLPRLCAQEQERKLIDRLLKPDLTLQNRAQNKEFATKSTSGDRELKTRRFFWQHKTNPKTFSDTRSFSVRSFQTGSFQNQREMAASLPSKTVDKSDFAFETRTVEVRPAADSEKKISGNDFAGNRAFVAQGKSQKALSARKPPLTIDQVRELLNKNR